MWIPPGQYYDVVGGTSRGVSSAANSKGKTVLLSFTLFEVPIFAKGGTMLPLAPTAGEFIGFGKENVVQPVIGGAAREPELLTWEIYGIGATTKGSGTVWEDSRGSTDASFSLQTDGKTLELKLTAPGDKRRHRLELINVPPANTVKTCSPSTEFDSSLSAYDGKTLTLNLHLTVHSGADGGCVQVGFEESLSSLSVQTLLQVPYQQTRQRLHIIKQQFDDLCSTPGTFLMPLVEATNAAARLSADCQIGTDGAHEAWVREMQGFPTTTNAALSSLLSWAEECPKSRFSVRTAAECANFAAQCKAWICGSAVLGRMVLPACG